MKLMGIPISPFVRKVSVVLAIKELDYEHEMVMPGSPEPGFRALSPLGKIPVLVDGDFALADSSVICEYLEDAYPATAVMPRDAKDRAMARFLEEYADSKVTEAIAPIFIERFVNPYIRKIESDLERASLAEKELLPPHLDYLETRVPEQGFLFGDFSTADISIVSPLFNAAYGGYEVDSQRWPQYAAFMQRVAEFPAVKQVRDAEAQFVARMSGQN